MSETEKIFVKKFKNRAAIARVCGISRAAVSRWKNKIPRTRCYQIAHDLDNLFTVEDLVNINLKILYDQKNNKAA